MYDLSKEIADYLRRGAAILRRRDTKAISTKHSPRLMSHVLIRPHKAPLDDGKEAFEGIGVDIAARHSNFEWSTDSC
jgi:hypothetical protein